MQAGPVTSTIKREAVASEKPYLSEAKPEPEGIAGFSRKLEKFTVLVVDDETALRRAFASILRRADFDTKTASDGAEALELYKKGGIDLVLSDRQMPVMGGLELLRSLKAVDPNVKFVLVSGGLDSKEQEEFEKTGALMVLHKPIDADVLQAAVTHILNGAGI